MKLPNGFGSVYKLSGNRRNPYVAKKTKGWEIDPITGKSKQLYITVGYYPTRKEALTALRNTIKTPLIYTMQLLLSRKYMRIGQKSILKKSRTRMVIRLLLTHRNPCGK